MTSRTDGGQGKFFLEDLKVGQRFLSRSKTVDAGEIKAFAATYDPQPFHLDEHAARRA
jgi:acyl dehydratase